jgi:hypothetical protein
MVSISWKGSLTAAPVSPQIGWMYYNSLLGKTYIWDGLSWNIVSQDGQNGQDGTSPEGFLITWKGGLSSVPSSPQKGWAYYDTSQKKSYIWDGSSWQILAQDGQDGTGGSGSGTYGPWLYVILYTPLGNYTQYNTTVIDTVNFGKVGVGSTARSSTFYFGLIGGESTSFNLTGTPAIQVSGTDANCFTITQPSATSTVTGTYIMDASIAFTPTSAGTKTATITIPNDSPDKPNFSFEITGEGSIWPKTFDGGEGDGNDAPVISLIDNSGNLYFVGYGFELVNNHSGNDWWIKKFNSSGVEIVTGWNKKLDIYPNTSTYYDQPRYAGLDSLGNLYVSNNYNTASTFTLKFNPDGTEVTSGWHKTVGGIVSVDTQDNIFLFNGSTINYFTSTGSTKWAAKTITGFTPKYGTSDNDGNVYIIGEGTNLIDTYSQKDIWIKKFDSTGIEITTGWNKQVDWGHSDPENATKIIFDGTNIIAVGTGTDLINGASADDGWVKIFTKTGGELSTLIIPEADSVLVKIDSGNYWFSCGTSIDASIVKYNLSGTLLQKFAYNSKSPYIYNPTAILDSSNNIYIAGYASNLVSPVSRYDWIIRKFNNLGIEQ